MIYDFLNAAVSREACWLSDDSGQMLDVRCPMLNEEFQNRTCLTINYGTIGHSPFPFTFHLSPFPFPFSPFTLVHKLRNKFPARLVLLLNKKGLLCEQVLLLNMFK